MGSIGRFRLVAAVAGMVVLNLVGATVYVSPTGDPTAEGATSDAPTTLSHACEIVPAGTASEYSEIVLKAGTVENPEVYDLSAFGPNPNDTESVLCLPVGYITLRSEDAACDPRKVVVKGGYEAQSLRLLKVQGALQVSGITFEDFYTTTNGGVLDNSSNKSLIVSKCVFRHNYAATAGGALRLAADLSSTTGKALDCTFVSNRCAKARGGSAVRGGLVTNCCFRAQAGDWATTYGQVFRSDYIENLGGVFYCCNATDCEIISNRYVDANQAYNYSYTIMSRNGGADGGNFKMLRCRSFANRAAETWSGNFGLTLNDTCEDCTFDSNEGSTEKSYSGHYGTLKNCTFTGYANTIRTITYSATITGCTFTNNFTQIFMGGTISKSYIIGNCCENGKLYTGPQGAVSTVTDCLFASNKYYSIIDPYTAGKGNDRFYNCTFADNTVSADASVIANGFGDNSPAKLVNCLLYGNTGYDFRTTREPIIASNCLYQTAKGNFDPTLSGGNIVATRDAISRKPDELHPYGYRPTSRSEARDAGLDVGRGGEGDTDLTTVTPRVIGTAIDIGCYEYEPLNGLILILR